MNEWITLKIRIFSFRKKLIGATSCTFNPFFSFFTATEKRISTHSQLKGWQVRTELSNHVHSYRGPPRSSESPRLWIWWARHPTTGWKLHGRKSSTITADRGELYFTNQSKIFFKGFFLTAIAIYYMYHTNQWGNTIYNLLPNDMKSLFQHIWSIPKMNNNHWKASEYHGRPFFFSTEIGLSLPELNRKFRIFCKVTEKHPKNLSKVIKAILRISKPEAKAIYEVSRVKQGF